MSKKIPVTIITGFLGSGKTTLLNRALRDPRLRNTAVVVNEFGEIGLDHELIEASSDYVFLLENGCLCCSVRGELISTLGDLFQKRSQSKIPCFDNVVIETSGLAEPTPILEVLTADISVKSNFTPAGIVSTVDAVNALDTINNHEQSLKQIALADRIVITKSELASHQPDVITQISSLNPDAELFDARTVNAGELFRFDLHENTGYDLPTPSTSNQSLVNPSNSSHNHNTRIKRFSIIRNTPWNTQTLRLFLDALGTNAGQSLLRVKGIVHIGDSPERPAVINGAQQLIHKVDWLDRWPSTDRRTRIVFITLDWGPEEVGELINYIERFSNATQTAREAAGF